MFIRKLLILFTICLVLLSQNLFSQIVLQGTVTDNGAEYLGNGAEPVVGALVTVTDQADMGRTFSACTDDLGHYSIEISQTTVDDDPSVTPGSYRLLQNYPNPFNPSTVIGYGLSKPAYISIEIYNVLGQKIKTLIDGFQTTSGQVIWNGTNDMGQGVPAGLYIYTLKVGKKKVNKKMLLIDGHQGSVVASGSRSLSKQHGDNTILHKQLSDQYTLTVTGDSIATYEQHDLEITASMTVDVTVTRTLTDIDGNVYTTVKIGDQWWMAENLRVTHYRNGEFIPHVTGNLTWENLKSSAYCNYNNDITNVATYGRLYNWYAISESRNIAPTGWHVPTDEEWKELEMLLGISQSDADATGDRGTDEGGKMKTTGTIESDDGLWYHPNTGATNLSGFSVLPGGYRDDVDGSFDYMGELATFWSSTRYGSTGRLAWCRGLKYNSSGIRRYYGGDFQSGRSIRCARD